MDHQPRLELPPPRAFAGGLRVWLLAAETWSGFSGHRHIFIDAGNAGPLVEPGDLILQRNAAGEYVLLGPESFSSIARGAVLDHLRHLSTARDLQARRQTDVIDVLDIALTPGRSRGRLAEDGQDVRSRTAFEHALLSLAARHEAGQALAALSAAKLAKPALVEGVHPLVRGIFRREHADILQDLFSATGETEFAEGSAPEYEAAAWAFQSAGFRHQSSSSRAMASAVRSTLNQPWLDGLPRVPEPARHALGYSVNRNYGFAVSLEAPSSWYAPSPAEGAYTAYGRVSLTDSGVMALLGDAPCASRRPVAVVHATQDGLLLRVGLAGAMEALLHNLPDLARQDEVDAISIESASLDRGDGDIWLGPKQPIVVRVRRCEYPQSFNVKLAMRDGDDLSLRFSVEGPSLHPQVFI